MHAPNDFHAAHDNAPASAANQINKKKEIKKTSLCPISRPLFKNILVRNSSRVTDHVDFYHFHEPTPRRVQSKTLRQKFDNLSPKKS